jgi:dihydroxyacetone kinase-like protein
MVNRDNLLAWVDALAQVYADNKQYLTQLDSNIGDADHGINMDRGFQAVKADLEKTTPQDISAILKTVAMSLIRTVGGASGPLYGTFFMRASAVCANKAELGPAEVVALFEAGLEGVLQRGKAELNDKTMVDAQKPALEAMKQALADGADIQTILQKGVTAADEGVKNTIPLQARKGRASYLGERSIGHQDPGATSSYLLLKAAADLWA